MTATLASTQQRISEIVAEMNDTHFERSEVIQAIWTGAVSQQHLLMVGPGGTGKSMVCRDFVSRIDGSTYFEIAMDETTTPDQILGAPDIKAMVEEGKVRRVGDGMLPSASHAFLDEFFNANGPALHCTMPILNERVFHNNGKPVPTPLRSAVMGTNKLNADQDQAALWDRVHLRHQVGYVSDRDNLRALLNAAVLRQVSTYEKPKFTTVSLTDLDIAHDEAMLLPFPEIAEDTFLDLLEELGRSGVVVGTRRAVEGRKAVQASAWLAGHDEVKVGDLSVLRHMFWSRQEEVTTVKNVILSACNPGEKQALDLLLDLDQLKADYAAACELDEMKRNVAAIDVFKKAQVLIDKAAPLKATAIAAGAGVQRIDDLHNGAHALRVKIGKESFNMDEETIANMPQGRR
jgi:MoxR-like ATPase